MAQAPRDLIPYESPLHFFGAELRHWRTLRGLSQAQVGMLTHDSSATIGKVEVAARRPTMDLARRLDAALETGGVFERLAPLALRQVVDVRPHVDNVDGSDSDNARGGGADRMWARTPADIVTAVTDLWRADVRRRTMITTAWLATALAEPLGRWLLDPVDSDAQHTGARAVGQADVDALWTMSAAFADADHQLGGGYARGTLIHFADQVMTPLLEGSYTDAMGRRLFAAAARLCDVAGFMCFDSGQDGLGQRYYVAALRMAKVSRDQALGAHILADMSMQAHQHRHPDGALALADAAVTAARGAGSASTLARCHAMRARALALAGEATGSDHALNDAERTLDQAKPDDEPFWIRFFTPAQLAAESMYAAADLGRTSHVIRHAVTALGSSGGMRRRHVIATATLANAHLPAHATTTASSADVDHACYVMRDVLPVIASLTSARAFGSINSVRGRLNAYADRPLVQQLERDLHHALAGT